MKIGVHRLENDEQLLPKWWANHEKWWIINEKLNSNWQTYKKEKGEKKKKSHDEEFWLEEMKK